MSRIDLIPTRSAGLAAAADLAERVTRLVHERASQRRGESLEIPMEREWRICSEILRAEADPGTQSAWGDAAPDSPDPLSETVITLCRRTVRAAEESEVAFVNDLLSLQDLAENGFIPRRLTS